MRRVIAILLLMLSGLVAPASAWAQSAPACQFILGFKTFDNLDTADIGACTDNQSFAANGDAQQHTTTGLMAWRKLDNWTAFTNGYWTWINGPSGLAQRLNTQRFSWEANPSGLPSAYASGSAAASRPPTAAPVGPPPSASGAITLDPSWANALAAKYGTIGGVTFAFTVTLHDAAAQGDIATAFPYVYLTFDDVPTGAGLAWLQLPRAAKQQAVSAMLQDVKSHWPNRMVALDVKGTSFCSSHFYSGDPLVYQDHDNLADCGWYTVFYYAKTLYDPGTGDSLQLD